MPKHTCLCNATNAKCKPNHMVARHSKMQTTQTLVVATSKACWPLSLACRSYATYKVTASASTHIRCAIPSSTFLLSAIKPEHLPILTHAGYTLCQAHLRIKQCYPLRTRLDPASLPQTKPCTRLEIKPNLVGACIQKSFDATLDLCAPSRSHPPALIHTTATCTFAT